MSDSDQVEAQKIRAAFYVDGFNLYHAIDKIGKAHLKWASYWRLAQIVIPQKSQQLVGVTYCTAYYPGDALKKWRHDQLIGAQKCHGVEVVPGHFITEPRDCRACQNTWQHPTEKEGDINVAIHLLRDAFLGAIDHAYIVTADSDQAATVKMFRKQFPEKTITAVVPPGKKRSEDLHRHVNGGTIMLNETHIERAVMPTIVYKQGLGSYRRPDQYAPPEGWVHPDNRPAKK